MNTNGELAKFPGHALRAIVSVTKDKKNDQSRSGIREVDVYEGGHRADYSNKTVSSASSLKEPYYENYNQVMENRNVSVLDHTPSQNGGQENLHAALCRSDGGLVTFDCSASYDEKDLEAELDSLDKSEKRKKLLEKEQVLEARLAKFQGIKNTPNNQKEAEKIHLFERELAEIRQRVMKENREDRDNSDSNRSRSASQNVRSLLVPGYIATPRPVRREHLSVSRSTGYAPVHHNHSGFHQKAHPDSRHRGKTNGCSRSASLSRASIVEQRWDRPEPLQGTKGNSKQWALRYVQPKPNLAGPESVSVHRPELYGWTDNKGMAEFYLSRALQEQRENQHQVEKSRGNKASTVKSQTSSPQGNHAGLKIKGLASSRHPAQPLKRGPENKPEVNVRENRSTETQAPLVAESRQPDQLSLGEGAVSPPKRVLHIGFQGSSPSKAEFTLLSSNKSEEKAPAKRHDRNSTEHDTPSAVSSERKLEQVCLQSTSEQPLLSVSNTVAEPPIHPEQKKSKRYTKPSTKVERVKCREEDYEMVISLRKQIADGGVLYTRVSNHLCSENYFDILRCRMAYKFESPVSFFMEMSEARNTSGGKLDKVPETVEHGVDYSIVKYFESLCSALSSSIVNEKAGDGTKKVISFDPNAFTEKIVEEYTKDVALEIESYLNEDLFNKYFACCRVEEHLSKLFAGDDEDVIDIKSELKKELNDFLKNKLQDLRKPREEGYADSDFRKRYCESKQVYEKAIGKAIGSHGFRGKLESVWDRHQKVILFGLKYFSIISAMGATTAAAFLGMDAGVENAADYFDEKFDEMAEKACDRYSEPVLNEVQDETSAAMNDNMDEKTKGINSAANKWLPDPIARKMHSGVDKFNEEISETTGEFARDAAEGAFKAGVVAGMTTVGAVGGGAILYAAVSNPLLVLKSVKGIMLLMRKLGVGKFATSLCKNGVKSIKNLGVNIQEEFSDAKQKDRKRVEKKLHAKGQDVESYTEDEKLLRELVFLFSYADAQYSCVAKDMINRTKELLEIVFAHAEEDNKKMIYRLMEKKLQLYRNQRSN